jgi:hypothetical protein
LRRRSAACTVAIVTNFCTIGQFSYKWHGWTTPAKAKQSSNAEAIGLNKDNTAKDQGSQ